jgi:hypothetical protein
VVAIRLTPFTCLGCGSAIFVATSILPIERSHHSGNDIALQP